MEALVCGALNDCIHVSNLSCVAIGGGCAVWADGALSDVPDGIARADGGGERGGGGWGWGGGYGEFAADAGGFAVFGGQGDGEAVWV